MSPQRSRASYFASQEWGTYKRLVGYAWPYKWRLFMGVLFGAISGGSTFSMIVSLQGGMVDTLDGQDNFLNRWLADVLGQFQNLDQSPLLLTAAILSLLVISALFRSVGMYLSKYYIQWVGHRVVMDVRNMIYDHMLYQSLSYFSRNRTGELMSRTTSDTQLVERGVSSVLGDLSREPFMLAAAVALLLVVDVQLTLISLVLFPLCIVPVSLFGRRVRKSSRKGQAYLGDLSSILQETISGIRIVKAFGAEQKEIRKFFDRCQAVFRKQVSVTRSAAAVSPIIELVSALAGCMVLIYARWSGLSWDELFIFMGALVLMYDPVKKLSRIHIGIQQSSAAADRIFEVLDTNVTVQDDPEAVELHEEISSIHFNNVTFAYDDEHVLEQINLNVKAGECIAFVGSSGSGKTTLVSLIPRFFDVSRGAVEINGKDIRGYTQKSLRKQMGMVTQDTVLFNDTVAGNISYGMDDVDRDQIIAAARRAHADGFIRQLPQGYDTVIGERGIRLSGGQQQRLSIARAILRNPPVLILDEATSALDSESERQVQAAIDEIMHGRTVFAIAHRLSTIAHADRIVVLEQGRIVEQGRHAELLEHGGVYKYLYDLQFMT